VRTIDATGIALEIIGRPIVNTTLLGAFAGATGEISIESIKRSVLARFPGKVGELNVRAAEKAYQIMAATERTPHAKPGAREKRETHEIHERIRTQQLESLGPQKSQKLAIGGYFIPNSTWSNVPAAANALRTVLTLPSLSER